MPGSFKRIMGISMIFCLIFSSSFFYVLFLQKFVSLSWVAVGTPWTPLPNTRALDDYSFFPSRAVFFFFSPLPPPILQSIFKSWLGHGGGVSLHSKSHNDPPKDVHKKFLKIKLSNHETSKLYDIFFKIKKQLFRSTRLYILFNFLKISLSLPSGLEPVIQH